jgi:hypothetical protein
MKGSLLLVAYQMEQTGTCSFDQKEKYNPQERIHRQDEAPSHRLGHKRQVLVGIDPTRAQCLERFHKNKHTESVSVSNYMPRLVPRSTSSTVASSRPCRQKIRISPLRVFFVHYPHSMHRILVELQSPLRNNNCLASFVMLSRHGQSNL